MSKVIITFDSVTYAAKAKKILNKNGIDARIIKLSFSSSYSGCTSGLELNVSDFLSAASFLRTSGINYGLLNKIQ